MPEFCAHLGYLFTEMPLAERFAAAKTAGFDWVEHPAPYAFGVDDFAKACADHGLQVAQIAAPAGDGALGEKGFACLAAREDDFVRSLHTGVDAALRISARFLHIMPGIIEPDTQEHRDRLRELYSSRIAMAADYAAANEVSILIEPINNDTIPGFYMNDPRFAAEVLNAIARPNAFMLLDVYHAVNRGLDPVAFWDRAGHLVGHIQIADAPGRHEPGSGKIDFAAFFAAIHASGYAGVVGLEYKPQAGTLDGLGWRAQFV